MKSVLIYIVILSLFAFTNVQGAESDSTAILNVPYFQDSLVVYLDDAPLGKTPVHTVISTGAHDLIIQSPSWPSWDQPDFIDSFVALPGQEYKFTPEFKEIISINSNPFGAIVYNNGKEIGTTPLNITFENNSEIILKLTGYKSYVLDIENLAQSAYFVSLVPSEEWVLFKKQNEINKKKNVGRNKKLFFASLGFAAAAGFTTSYLRSRGNEEFDKYETAAIPSAMDEHFSEAQRYDRLASVSYALFEVAFISSGYFFLTSRE